ncbi:MAG: rod shape-determining protein RodA [Propionibacteriales bacterium]|nr:rod shape-determining protein RodA [Propionibacteriales bacterium]
MTTRTSRRIHVTESRATWQRLDWLVVFSTAALLVVGSLLVWSATASNEALSGANHSPYIVRHLTNIAIGLALAALVAAIDHRWLRIWAPVVYLGGIVGLGLVLSPLGAVVNGSRSWILVGSMSIQPAEFAKLGVVAGMALLLAERTEARRAAASLRGWDVVAALGIAAVPAGLILAQPDLGTLLVLAATVFGLLAVAGAPRRWLAGLVGAAVGAAVGAVQLGVLQGYQLLRFEAFINPALDPQGAGYNTTQARIAIGNGGLFGQGLFHGSQTQSGFVPEQHTDFVFTVAGEELGLLGSGALIALFLALLWRASRIAVRADDMFGRLAGAGIVCWFGFQAFQNIGMCLGIMPVTGVPLPLVSYGGTSMFASLMAVGLLLNIHLRSERSLGLGVVLRSRVSRSRRF